MRLSRQPWVGLGWALHPQIHLDSGGMVELVPGSPLDVPLYWQQARIASRVMDSLSHTVASSARAELIQD
ncbi:hypothetical protein [Malikia granosa]|uniref:Uncharacterized protein n=1 Tax=Malikia granosa TaxID=263067 RepID=A0A2S9K2K6_9BURK|nr:hypothetical protein [Malikia granosa]PRD64689.1 hypothetical protein C6P64_13260 [Malikia granosa]